MRGKFNGLKFGELDIVGIPEGNQGHKALFDEDVATLMGHVNLGTGFGFGFSVFGINMVGKRIDLIKNPVTHLPPVGAETLGVKQGKGKRRISPNIVIMFGNFSKLLKGKDLRRFGLLSVGKSG